MIIWNKTVLNPPETVWRHLFKKLSLLFVFLFFIQAAAPGEAFASSYPPSLVASLRLDAPLNFCNEQVPVNIPDIRERLEKEILISLGNRHQVILWLKRSGRHMPYIEEMLKQNNMPDDLKYVAVIESALRPHVGSPKGAMGFWQFIAPTGRKYGLTINRDIDERRNIFPSTSAAIRYFKELYKQFNSWTLAAAAYNIGEEGLGSKIINQEVRDYYNLYLPLETRRYIFRIIAAKMIMSNPEKYGFYLSGKDLYPPQKFDCIDLQCSRQIPVLLIAKAANTQFKTIKDLNPEIRKSYLPKGVHTIRIPKGTEEKFHANYETILSNWMDSSPGLIYIVKKGDNLFAIANRFNVPLVSLYTWNQITGKTIYPGNRLIIHPPKGMGSNQLSGNPDS